MRLPTFTGHPYPARVHFVPGPAAWANLMARLDLSEPYPTTAGRCTALVRRSGPDVIAITLSPEAEDTDPDEIIALMAHEVVHAVQFLEDAAGSTFDRETQAYLTQAILLWLMQAYPASGRRFREPTP
jgi:hypothetical protein